MSEPVEVNVRNEPPAPKSLGWYVELAKAAKELGILGGGVLVASALLWPNYGFFDRQSAERKASEDRFISFSEKSAAENKAIAKELVASQASTAKELVASNASVAKEVVTENARAAEKLQTATERNADKVTTALHEVVKVNSEFAKVSSELAAEVKKLRAAKAAPKPKDDEPGG